MKMMSLKEFQQLGLLQEINRRLLHPMGLALGVVEDLNTGDIHFDGIWDYTDDADGMIFSEEITSTKEWKQKAARVEKMFEAKREKREEALGYHVQPIGDE